MNSKMKKIIRNPALLFLTLGRRGFFNWMDDETYLRIAYRIRMGKKLNLNLPTTFNEKLQWLKLYDRKPEYTQMVDKYEAKKYVGKIIGEQHIIPTFGVWNTFDEIEFGKLPDQFVLKCTHNSGGVVICRDKNKFDIGTARKKINTWLKYNYFWGHREWPYKNVKPRVIAEKYMEDETTHDLRDYKFFTFNGVAKVMYVATERWGKEETKFDFFDMNFRHLDLINGHPNASLPPSKPANFEEMKQLAEELSRYIPTPHLRVDFYEVNGKVYFGELTFFHLSGLMPSAPEKWDKILGSWIKLPKSAGKFNSD